MHYHYRISKSSDSQSESIIYTHAIKNMKYNKIRCFQLHINGYNIPIEKYYTKILTWNRKSKRTEYLNGSELNSPDIKIVLYDYGIPSYHDFSISWTHITPKNIYTESDHINIILDERYSYSIQSTLYVDIEHIRRDVDIVTM